MTLKINVDRNEVSDGRKTVRLPRREFELICLLARAKGKVMTRDVIMRDIWGEFACDTRAVDQQVARIRRKIGAHFIRTVPYYGYASENVEFVNEPKVYGVIRGIDRVKCTALVAVDFDTLPSLKIGGAVKVL